MGLQQQRKQVSLKTLFFIFLGIWGMAHGLHKLQLNFLMKSHHRMFFSNEGIFLGFPAIWLVFYMVKSTLKDLRHFYLYQPKWWIYTKLILTVVFAGVLVTMGFFHYSYITASGMYVNKFFSFNETYYSWESVELVELDSGNVTVGKSTEYRLQYLIQWKDYRKDILMYKPGKRKNLSGLMLIHNKLKYKNILFDVKRKPTEDDLARYSFTGSEYRFIKEIFQVE